MKTLLHAIALVVLFALAVLAVAYEASLLEDALDCFDRAC